MALQGKEYKLSLLRIFDREFPEHLGRDGFVNQFNNVLWDSYFRELNRKRVRTMMLGRVKEEMDQTGRSSMDARREVSLALADEIISRDVEAGRITIETRGEKKLCNMIRDKLASAIDYLAYGEKEPLRLKDKDKLQDEKVAAREEKEARMHQSHRRQQETHHSSPGDVANELEAMTKDAKPRHNDGKKVIITKKHVDRAVSAMERLEPRMAGGRKEELKLRVMELKSGNKTATIEPKRFVSVLSDVATELRLLAEKSNGNDKGKKG